MQWTTFETWLRSQSDRPRFWFAVVAASLLVQVSSWWYPTPDATSYLSIARSLVRGEHLANLGNVQLLFPPGYPALISPAFLFGDRPFLLIAFAHWCIALVLMAGVYRWARHRFPAAAVLLTGLVMVNVSVWMVYRRTLSELAFMTVLMWTVSLLPSEGWLRPARVAIRSVLPASVLLVLLSVIREVGVVLAVGFGLRMFAAARAGYVSRAMALAATLVVGLPATTAVLALIRYDQLMVEQSEAPALTHLGQFRDTELSVSRRLREGLRVRISEVGRLLVPGMFKAYGAAGVWLDPNLAVYVPVFLLVAAGWWALVRRQGDVLALSFPFYFAVYVAFPKDQGTRFLVPMLPLLWGCVWCALATLRSHRLPVLAALLAGHAAVATGYWIGKEIPRARECHAQWAYVDELARAIRPVPARLAARGIPECVRLMLALAIDRPVLDEAQPAARGLDVQWLVTSADRAPDAGFSRRTAVGPYQLMCRQPSGS